MHIFLLKFITQENLLLGPKIPIPAYQFPTESEILKVDMHFFRIFLTRPSMSYGTSDRMNIPPFLRTEILSSATNIKFLLLTLNFCYRKISYGRECVHNGRYWGIRRSPDHMTNEIDIFFWIWYRRRPQTRSVAELRHLAPQQQSALVATGHRPSLHRRCHGHRAAIPIFLCCHRPRSLTFFCPLRPGAANRPPLSTGPGFLALCPRG